MVSHRLQQEQKLGLNEEKLNVLLRGGGAMGRRGLFLVQEEEIKDKGRWGAGAWFCAWQRHSKENSKHIHPYPGVCAAGGRLPTLQHRGTAPLATGWFCVV